MPTLANVFLSASDERRNPTTFKICWNHAPYVVHVFLSLLLFYAGFMFSSMSLLWNGFCETEATIVGLVIARHANLLVLILALWWRTRNLKTYNANAHLESWSSYRESQLESRRWKRVFGELLASGGLLLLFVSIAISYIGWWWFPWRVPKGLSACSSGDLSQVDPWMQAQLFTMTVYSYGPPPTTAPVFLARYVLLIFALIYVGVSFFLMHFSFFRTASIGMLIPLVPDGFFPTGMTTLIILLVIAAHGVAEPIRIGWLGRGNFTLNMDEEAIESLKNMRRTTL